MHAEFALAKFAGHAKICLLELPHHPPLTPQENQMYRVGFPGWKLASRLGVLLVNLGSPQAPTASAVRRFLAEF